MENACVVLQLESIDQEFPAAIAATPSRTEASSDEELVRRFAIAGDEAALAELMRRHGPMVMGVCCRTMASRQDAEDVYQTVWLIFTRKAGNLKKKALVANWLYGVAYRVGVKFRHKGILQTLKEQEAAAMNAGSRESDEAWKEVREVVDEELQRLREYDRAPLLLCCVEGQTLDEAASCLGWTQGKLRGRLQRARELLRKRLTQRGITVSSAVFASVLTPQYTVAAPTLAPTSLLASAANAATGGAATVKTAGLLQEGLKLLFWEKVKCVAIYSALGAAVVGGSAAISQLPLASSAVPSPAVSVVTNAQGSAVEPAVCEVRTVGTNGQPVAGIAVLFRQYGTTNRLSVTTDASGCGRVSMSSDASRPQGGPAPDVLPWMLSRASAPSGTWLHASSVTGDTAFHPSAGWVVTGSSTSLPRIVVTMSESSLAFEGRVITPEGNPLSDCVVTATRKGGLNDFGTWSNLLDPDDDGQRLTFQTRTDTDGKYRIPAPRGEWFLGIAPPQDTLYNGVPLSRVLNAASTVDEIRLQQGGAVAVRVTDREKKPVEGAELELRWIPGGYVHGRRTATDKDGYVRWRGLYVHRYEAVLLGLPPQAGPGPSPRENRSPIAEPRKPMSPPVVGIPVSQQNISSPSSVEVEVKQGEWANATLELPPPTPPEPPKKGDRILCVNLAGEDRAPLGGFAVEIQKHLSTPALADDPRVNASAPAKILSVSTSTNGAAVFPDLTPGSYRIKAIPPAAIPYAIVEGHVGVSETEPESTARVTVPKACKVEGAVRDDAGRPAPDRMVSLYVWLPDTNAVPPVESRKVEEVVKEATEAIRSARRMDGGQERGWRDPSFVAVSFAETNRTDTSGRFVFERVPRGVARIEAKGDGTNLLSISITTNLGSAASHDVALTLRRRQPLALSGCVTGEDGKPLQGVTVTFKGRQTLSDTNGCYEFNSTPYPWPRPTVTVPDDMPCGEGRYAMPPAWAGEDKPIARDRQATDDAWCPQEGGDFRLDINLPPVFLARLKLEDSTGAPVPRCALEILEASGTPQRGDLLGSRIESPYMRHGRLGRIFQSNDKGIVFYKTTSVGRTAVPNEDLERREEVAKTPGSSRDRDGLPGRQPGRPPDGNDVRRWDVSQQPLRLQFVPVPMHLRPATLELPIQGKVGFAVDYTVRMESNHDVSIQVIEQASGKGLPAEVTLVPMDIREGPDMQRMFGITVKTDPAGVVRVCGLLAPKYRVEAKNVDTERFFRAVEQPFVEPHAGLNGVEIAMRETGGLVVRVVDEKGVPVPAIRVTAWGKELGMVPRVDSPRYWSGSANAQGMCRVPICGGTLMVEAKVSSISGPVPGPVFVAPPRREVQVSETSVTRVDIPLQRGAVVCARLFGPDGDPRKRDTIEFRHKTSSFTAWGYVRQQDSNAYWVGPLLPGTYSIGVSANMNGSMWSVPPSASSFEVTVEAGERKDIELRLKDLPKVPTNTIQRIDPATLVARPRTSPPTHVPAGSGVTGVVPPRVGPTEEQKQFVQRAIEKANANPRDADTQRSAAQALRLTGDPARAADYYGRAIAIDDQTATRWDLAYVLTSAGKHREAIAAFKALLDRALPPQERDSAVKAIAEGHAALGEPADELKFLSDNLAEIRTPNIRSWATARIGSLRARQKPD